MLWKAAPKPSMGDDMYDDTWWDLTTPERYAKMHDYTFCIKNDEPIFDAAVRFKTLMGGGGAGPRLRRARAPLARWGEAEGAARRVG